jgi:calcineurin-like phosphoesterase family protein
MLTKQEIQELEEQVAKDINDTWSQINGVCFLIDTAHDIIKNQLSRGNIAESIIALHFIEIANEKLKIIKENAVKEAAKKRNITNKKENDMNIGGFAHDWERKYFRFMINITNNIMDQLPTDNTLDRATIERELMSGYNGVIWRAKNG